MIQSGSTRAREHISFPVIIQHFERNGLSCHGAKLPKVGCTSKLQRDESTNIPYADHCTWLIKQLFYSDDWSLYDRVVLMRAVDLFPILIKVVYRFYL